MKCAEFKENLVSYLYGEGSENAYQRAMDHTRECPSCRSAWEGVMDIRKMMALLPDKKAPKGLVENLLAMARYASPARPALKRPSWLPSLVPSWNWAPAFVMVFFVIAGGTLLMQSKPTSQYLTGNYKLPYPIRGVALEEPPFEDSFVFLPSPQNQEGNSPNLKQVYQERFNALLETDADMLLMRGRRYKTSGRVDLALRDFETIYRFYPAYTFMGDVLMYRAQCFAFQGKYNQAIESLEFFMKREPSKKSLILPMIEQLESAASKSEKN